MLRKLSQPLLLNARKRRQGRLSLFSKESAMLHPLRRGVALASLGLLCSSLLTVAVRADAPAAASAAPAQAAPKPSPFALTEEMRRQDPRLQKRVTLVSPRVHIGELMEHLARQSGVAVAASDATGAGDAEVTVALHDVPLGDAMDALWSLVSYQSAEWEWRRSGDAGHYEYQLARSDAARSLASAMKAQIQGDVENQAKTLIDALKMSPEELAQVGAKDPLVQSMIDDGRVRPSISLFAALPPDVQSDMLRNQKTLLIPVSDMTPQMQVYVDQLWQWQQDSTDKGFREHPEWLTAPPPPWYKGPPPSRIVPKPKDVGISVHVSPVSAAPMMTVDLGWGSGDFFGGLWEDKALRRRLDAFWRLSGDADGDAQTAKKAATPKTPPPSEKDSQYPNRLIELAQAAPLSLIARVPQAQGTVSISTGDVRPYGMTVQAYLDLLDKEAHFQHKWRDGVLLVSNPAWFVLDNDDVVAPWAVVRRLRDAEAAAGDGFLSVDDLARTASDLSEPSLRRLARQYPVMDSVAHWRDLLALLHREPSLRPYLLSSQGSTRRTALEAVAPTLGLNIDPLYRQGIMPHTRLVQRQGTLGGAPARTIMIEVVKPDGSLLASQGFSYPSRQYRPSVQDQAP